MTAAASVPVLHAVRLLGFADTAAVAIRARLPMAAATAALTEAQAHGWVEWTEFADLGGWSLTVAGRAEGERLLAAERQQAGCEDELHAVHTDFLPLNARLLRACTDWQVRPGAGGDLAVNDHSDLRWDGQVLDELAALSRGLVPLVERLAAVLPRFGGYDLRFERAVQRARAGERDWVEGSDVDSCHRVWFELHEDLIATLGIERGGS